MNDPRWKDKLYTAAIIATLVCLVTLVFNIQRRAAQTDAKNLAAAQEAEADTQRRRQAGEDIHARLLEALAEGPKGFVCWGDGNAVGNGRGSPAAAFADLVDDTFFAPLRGEFSRRAELYDVGGFEIDGVNMGAQNEGFYEIMARTGANPMLLGQDFNLPAGYDRVNLALADKEGRTLRFAEQPYAKFGATTIDGVEGLLYTGRGAYDRLHVRLAFGRSAGGEGRVIPAGTPVETEGAAKYREYCPILFFSEQGKMDAEAFIGGLWEAISLYGQGRHYAVLCVTAEDSPWDAALKAAFGERYLRWDTPVGQMTAANYAALAEALLDCFERQDAFAPVHSAVDQALEELRGLGEQAIGNRE